MIMTRIRVRVTGDKQAVTVRLGQARGPAAGGRDASPAFAPTGYWNSSWRLAAIRLPSSSQVCGRRILPVTVMVCPAS